MFQSSPIRFNMLNQVQLGLINFNQFSSGLINSVKISLGPIS